MTALLVESSQILAVLEYCRARDCYGIRTADDSSDAAGLWGSAGSTQRKRHSKHGEARRFQIQPLRLHANLCRLHALLAFVSHEGNGLTFLQAFETVAFNGLEVDEQVLTATLRRDEAEAFLIVEPLYGAGLSIRHMVYLQEECFQQCCAAQDGVQPPSFRVYPYFEWARPRYSSQLCVRGGASRAFDCPTLKRDR